MSKQKVHRSKPTQRSVYNKNKKCKTSKINKETTWQKNFHLPGLADVTLWKTSVITKTIHKFNSKPIKILITYLTELEKKSKNSQGDTKHHK